MTWDRILSRFNWGGKKPRVRYETLQLAKDKGGMGLPKLNEYFYAAQFRHIICGCMPDYTAKWKDGEIEFVKNPFQSLIGDQEIHKRTKNNIDSITTFTLELMVQSY